MAVLTIAYTRGHSRCFLLQIRLWLVLEMASRDVARSFLMCPSCVRKCAAEPGNGASRKRTASTPFRRWSASCSAMESTTGARRGAGARDLARPTPILLTPTPIAIDVAAGRAASDRLLRGSRSAIPGGASVTRVRPRHVLRNEVPRHGWTFLRLRQPWRSLCRCSRLLHMLAPRSRSCRDSARRFALSRPAAIYGSR